MTPSTDLVMRYWWAMGMMGTWTPAIAATFGVYMPHAATTASASMVPWSVTTSAMRPSRTTRSTTRVPVCTRTPLAFAAPARARVRPLGSR